MTNVYIQPRLKSVALPDRRFPSEPQRPAKARIGFAEGGASAKETDPCAR
jgi:hypothetical protein